MNKKLLTIAALTLLLSGQTVMAGDNSGDADDFLNWLNAGQETVQVDKPLQFDKISIQKNITEESGYKPEEDLFSIHYMGAK